MMTSDDTLCKGCNDCKHYTYERTSKKGIPIIFQYCKGGEKEVKLSNWYIQKDGYPYSTSRINNKQKTFYHTLFKKDKSKNIDHINGVRNDNRLCNLREITPLWNAQNKHKKHTSDYPGVYWNPREKKWCSQIKKGKQGRLLNKNLGYYKHEEEAFHEYKIAIESLGGSVDPRMPKWDKYNKWLAEKEQTKLM